MDKALGKLGIYDIVGIWLSGAITFSVLYLLSKYVYFWDLSSLKFDYTEFVFIILAYFLGVVLQEIGNLFQMRLLNKNERHIRGVLKIADWKTKLLSNSYLTDKEIEGIEDHFKENGYENCEPSFKFQYCRNNLPSEYDYSEQNQSMAVGALSRSLAVSFVIFSIVGIINISICGITPARIICTLLCPIMTVLLWSRSTRLLKMRYEKVFRAFYYNHIDK